MNDDKMHASAFTQHGVASSTSIHHERREPKQETTNEGATGDSREATNEFREQRIRSRQSRSTRQGEARKFERWPT